MRVHPLILRAKHMVAQGVLGDSIAVLEPIDRARGDPGVRYPTEL